MSPEEVICEEDCGVKAVLIARKDGLVLTQAIVDKTGCSIQPDLLGGFIAALQVFGEENLGHLEMINLIGLELELMVTTYKELILIAIFDSKMPKIDIRGEATQALVSFYQQYFSAFQTTTVDLKVFNEFELILETQINDYCQKIRKIGHKGLFSRIIDSLR